MNQICVNGKVYTVSSSNSISITNNKVIVDGKEITDFDSIEEKEINIQISGDINSVVVSGKTTIQCNNIKNLTNSGKVECPNSKIETVIHNSGIIKS